MTKPFDYADASRKLDTVVEALQSPTITVDEAIKQYETGMELVAQLESYLAEAELKIKQLKVS